MITITLTGIVPGADNKWAKATTQQAKDVKYFVGSNPGSTKIYFRLDNTDAFKPVLVTPKGSYPLVQTKPNHFTSKDNTFRVELKKTVAKLVY